jgi:DNA-binding winged helix-turn-helix (wHTH) protein
MSDSRQQIYEFGDFRLEVSERRLLRDDDPLSLAPKVFDTLVLLVKNSGHLVEKDQLLKELWPDTYVEEVNLSVNISALRKVLGETEEGKSYIETVPKRGYRFTAAVTAVAPTNESLIVEAYVPTVTGEMEPSLVPVKKPELRPVPIVIHDGCNSLRPLAWHLASLLSVGSGTIRGRRQRLRLRLPSSQLRCSPSSRLIPPAEMKHSNSE